MTKDEIAARGLEAERISTDPTIRSALAAIRMEALERLATLDPNNPNEILEAQCIVRVSDGFLLMLQTMIVQGKTQEGPAVA